MLKRPLSDMKIAYIVSAFPCFSEAFILREMTELKKRGVSIEIFSLRRLREPVLQKEVMDFLPNTHYLPFCLSLRVWRDNILWLLKRPLKYIGCLWTVIADCALRPEILAKNLAIFPKSVSFARSAADLGITHIQSHFASYPTTTALIIYRLAGIPFTFSAHAHDIFYSKALLRPKFYEAKRVFTVSEYNKKYIFGLFPDLDREKLEILRSPVNCEKFGYRERARSGPLRILSVGRLATMKGYRFLIEACSILKKEGTDFSCNIIGNGPLKKGIEKQIKDSGLEDKVRVLGAITEERLLEEYESALIFALACVPTNERDTQDGLPAVLVEAMAIGIPVIATSLSGIPELVINDQTGILVPIKDPDAIAGAVKKLYNDRDLMIRLARNARKKVEAEFDIRKNVDRLMKVFF
ncbi:glycosyltransferase [Candidatus Omnitrophota bacterium]